MKIGVPKEIKTHEYRVGLTPAGARELSMHGHQVTVVGEVPPNTVEFIGRQFKATSKEASAAQGLSLAPPPHRK